MKVETGFGGNKEANAKSLLTGSTRSRAFEHNTQLAIFNDISTNINTNFVYLTSLVSYLLKRENTRVLNWTSKM